MATEHDAADLIHAGFGDRTTVVATPSPPRGHADTASTTPLSREEIESKVSETQQRLVELKRAQEALERERASPEEARRRRAELHTGREEMITHLARGIALLEQSEFAARQEAEQMGRTLANFRDALGRVQGIQESAWTQENWSVELTRALTAIENARMEWNSARLKWPSLNGDASSPGSQSPTALTHSASTVPAGLEKCSLTQLCRIGLALTWPLALISFLALAFFTILLLKR